MEPIGPWLVTAGAAVWLVAAYAGYPAVLLLLRALAPRPVTRADVAPSLSVIVAVYNGARELARKLESILAQQYPGPVEVIVSSDGSTDGTLEVARGFAARGVIALERRERRGKEAAQELALGSARGEVIVMTDVSGELMPGSLRQIVRPFADPAVGCVSSEDEVDSAQGEGAYVRYEMALRRLESEATSLVGVSGSFFAFRRELAASWRSDLASDFRTALAAVEHGYRAVSEPAARARFQAIDDPAAEWRRKVRTVRRGLAVLCAYRHLLHPRHGRPALSLWGHKVLRFGSPLALIALLAASLVGAPSDPALALLCAAQVAGYSLASAGLAWPRLRAILPVRIASFFLLVNASMLVAWVYHLGRQRAVVWEPTQRDPARG